MVKDMAIIPYSMTLAVGILLVGGTFIYLLRNLLDRETDYAGLMAIGLMLIAAILLLMNFPDVYNGKEVVEHFGGKGGGRTDYGQGLIDNMETNSSDVISKMKEKLNI